MSVTIEDIFDRYVRAYLTYYKARQKPDNMYSRLIGIAEKSVIKIALEECKGNQKRASELLGINRNTLHTKMKIFKIGDKK